MSLPIALQLIRFFVFSLLTIALLHALIPSHVYAAPDNAFVVNSANDADDGLCNGAHCSLREAINHANAHSGLDTITFNIGGCTCTIYPTTQLPVITDPVIIDGYSESGAVPAGNGSAPALKIILRGFQSPPFSNGLRISGGGSTVKGLVINGWQGAGIWLTDGGNNVIEGNFLGTLVNGLGASSNGWGVLISHGSSQNTIGGNLYASKNIIAANTVAGIEISDVAGSAQGNVILGNNIGANLDEAPLGNATGIILRTPNNIVGPSSLPLAVTNHILGNTGAGIELAGSIAFGNQVLYNLIGSLDTNTSGNGTYGVLIHQGAHNNKIGKPGKYNFISGNGADGVAVMDDTSQRNAIRGNYMFENGGLGVDLGVDGINNNDAQDADNGPNKLQNFPVITRANFNTERIKGKLVAAPNTNYTIDLYYSGFCDPLGYGEGYYFQSVSVTTNAQGIGKFSVKAQTDLTANLVVVGMAVDKKGNSSEFGKCKVAQ